MRYFAALLLIVVALSNAAARAETVTLTNGDRISGQVINLQNPLGLYMQTDFGQMIQIPWEQVEKMGNESFFSASSSSTSEKTTQTPMQKRIKLRPPPYDQNALEEMEIGTTEIAPDIKEPDAEEEPAVKWSGRINFGASLQTGNSEKESVNLDGQTKAEWGADKQHRALLKAEMHREEDDGDLTEDNRMVEGTYDYFYTKEWFINNTLSFEQDDIDQIDLRTKAGIALGHQVYDREDLALKYMFGPTYLREKFEDGDTEDSIAARWALDYEQDIIREALRFYHDHELLVPTDDTEDFLFDSKTGLRVPIRKGLVASAEIDFEWDNEPEPGIKEDDTKYALKIGYEW